MMTDIGNKLTLMKKHYTSTLMGLGLFSLPLHAAITTSTANSPLTGSPISVVAGTSESFQITGLGSSSGAFDNYRFGGANDATGFLTADYTVSAVGGDITSVGNNLVGARLKGIGLTTGAGVTSFTICTTFNRHLHGLLTGSTATQNPWLSSVMMAVPSGFNYDMEITYSDIASIVTNGTDNTIANGTAVVGLPSAYQNTSDYVVTAKTGLATASPTTTIAGSGATQTITVDANMTGGGSWLGLNSVRPNPPSSFTGSSSDFNSLSDPSELNDNLISRIQQVSARTVSFTFTAIDGGGVFPAGTEITTSMDGRQEVGIQDALTAVIPEPSSALLIALASTFLIQRREREI